MFDIDINLVISSKHFAFIVQYIYMQIYMYVLLWAIAHHFFAGIRYFLIDLEVIRGQYLW